MYNPFKFLENLIYRLRDILWDYPRILFEEDNNKRLIREIYKAGSPYSHFILAFILTTIIFVVFFFGSLPKILSTTQTKVIEGVVLGTDENSRPQEISKINPLILSNVQLERDLVQLIYEPLLRYEYVKQPSGTFSGASVNVLAEEILKIKQGADYEIRLKQDVLWHDQSKFNADDVIRTFDLVSLINDNNAFTQALKQMQWQKVSEYSIRICTKPINENPKGCSIDENKPILSNFLELISFNILPEHLTRDIDESSVNTNTPKIFRSPIGTGVYKFKNINSASLTLEKNNNYYNPLKNPKIEEIEFKFYKDTKEATLALKSGEVHSLATISVESKADIAQFPNININSSPVLYNQFWALYFNLRKDPTGKTIAPSFLSDIKVRKAISAAIDRSRIINEALEGVATEAFGPIPPNSYFFNKKAGWIRFNTIDSATLLDQAGWTFKNNNEFRTNDKEEVLRFSLYYVNNFDRKRVAEKIREDLKKIGIDVIIDRQKQPGGEFTASSEWNLQDLNNLILSPRNFDIILYGMNTFIDPDRFELYHSSQQNHPGLNIAGYIGTVQTVVRRENRKAGESSVRNVPKVDRWLELARSFDPESARKQRKERYDEVQDLIAKDVPIIYLYHPQFLYYTNKRVKNINLENVKSIEERFKNIEDWEI